MQVKSLFFNKNFITTLTRLVAVICIWNFFDSNLYNRINKIYLASDLDLIVDKIDYQHDYYKEYEKIYVVLDENLGMHENNVDDVIKLKNGQNLSSGLHNYGIDSQEISAISKALGSNFNLINPGQDIFINYDYKARYVPHSTNNDIYPKRHYFKEDYIVNHIEVRLNKIEKKIYLQRQNNAFTTTVAPLQSQKQTRVIKSKINNSLYYDAIQKGVTPIVINKMIEQYSYDIDFQRDIHKGDSFEVVFEEYYDDKSRKVKDGKLLYAGINVQGKWYRMYRFNDEFYNEKGLEIKKTLLKTPVDGARISSGFGVRRHPVLGFTRAHKGVDFAAPTGTPIYAAGDGTITHYSWGGGYGNLCTIKHTKEYSTNYAHMSRFAKGVKIGSYVKQRQVIGYIGTTGLSTGPHLHFELVKNGEKINPTKHHIQSIRTITGKSMTEFKNFVDQITKKIAQNGN
ncbi:M23 family metallopeptidase [Candidatus Deianiraea vastatrix]|uniref:M23 family peptidase n=1 Tax=Candidatus Deianiraea vastatrix TaxID=2163644 RepID=A0A5B8XDU3_9RICK|nr:peptidoglycan DD-metalloendopeptidase family protein [Candidatus Deianiraea vastatrix]QED23433.1 Putative M23 family peptidase [Candidatus Deianiraea vastatrix]